MRWFISVAALVFSVLAMQPANAGVAVNVNLSTQTMNVSVDGKHRYTWHISSGRIGYHTPNGVYRPQRLERNWYSRKYGGAMPSAVFFRGGYAIHGTSAIGALGRPASHGCIRLHPGNAATLFSLVKNHRGGTRIAITGSRPGGTRLATNQRVKKQAAYHSRASQVRKQRVAAYKSASHVSDRRHPGDTRKVALRAHSKTYQVAGLQARKAATGKVMAGKVSADKKWSAKHWPQSAANLKAISGKTQASGALKANAAYQQSRGAAAVQPANMVLNN